MNTVTIILCSVSLFLVAFIALTIKPRKAKILNQVGSCLVPLSKRRNWLFILVIILGIIMICLQLIRQFELYIAIILDAVAVLGIETTVKDFILQQLSGVYENAIIIDSRLIPKSDIVALPTLEYENSEEYLQAKKSDTYAADSLETAKTSLKIISNSSGEIYVSFANEEQRTKAVEVMKNWV